MFSSKKSTTLAIVGGVLFMFGLSYASVPLYQIFCQATGIGGTTQQAQDVTFFCDSQESMENRLITVRFTADVSNTMPWKFEPLSKEVQVMAGETALVFYQAENPTDHSMTGMSTYHVNPPQVGIYFHKIQCFCFEEQRLKSHEKIDMPVFFFLDPQMLDDPLMSDIDHVTLSYTFFLVDEE